LLQGQQLLPQALQLRSQVRCLLLVLCALCCQLPLQI
jgi:hypothetical protein